MKKIAIVIFDDFTDIDLFLMWDLFGRNKVDWEVKVLGSKDMHLSRNGVSIKTHGKLVEAKDADVVLFSSGRATRTLMKDQGFLQAILLDPTRQLIGSICSGALLLASLGLLNGLTATTHPVAKQELQSLGIEVIDQPLVCHGNIATAGGCLSGMYLVAWVVGKLYGLQKQDEVIKQIFPVGQGEVYSSLVDSVIRNQL